MDEILNILIKLAAMVLVFLVGRAGRYLFELLKTKLNEKQTEKLDLFIAELVAAAEQMYKKDDPDGTVRLNYVQQMLVEAGYDITSAVQALIESKVFSINLMNAASVIESIEVKPVIGFGTEPEGGEGE